MGPDPGNALVRRWSAWAGPLLFSCLYLSRIHFVPLWDGMEYYLCLDRALTEPFSIFNFNCFGHPTMGYMLVAALGQFFDRGNAELLHLVNLLLGVGAVFSFQYILAKLFPAPELAPERFLLGLVYAVFPVVPASGLNFSPDYGVLVFFLMFLAALLSGRALPAAAAGTLLVFSKEYGVASYAAATALYLFYFRPAGATGPKGLLASVRRKWALLIPGVLFCAYALHGLLTDRAVKWEKAGEGSGDLLLSLVRFNVVNRHFLAYIRGIFLIDGVWLVSLPLAVFLLLRLCGLLARRKGEERPPPAGREAAFLFSLFLAELFLLTRWTTFGNLRYVLPVYPLLFAAAWHALTRFEKNRRARAVLLSLAFLAVGCSNYWTWDPVSRGTYGVFKFGNRAQLDMTSMTGECCGYGRDQLVYNLQYTRYGDAAEAVARGLGLTGRETVLVNSGYTGRSEAGFEYHVFENIEPVTYQRSLRPEKWAGIAVTTLDALEREGAWPEELYYVDMPNFDGTGELGRLRLKYGVEWVKRFGEYPYTVPVYRMRKLSE